MSQIVVPVKLISVEAFAGYGDLLEAPASGARENFATAVENRRGSARANIALVRCEPFAFSSPIGMLERHAHSTQLFAPLDLDGYLIVVAKDTGRNEPDLATVSAFTATRHQAISYHAGIWHAGMTTLGRPGTFVVLIHEDGTPGDCEFVELPQKLLIELPGRHGHGAG
jgi:ureidoglycolate lyase